MATAANLRGQLAALVVDREELGREMDALVLARGGIDHETAEDYRRQLEEIDQRLHHIRHEIRKTSETG